jgi:integrase/recombinase XerD
MTDLRQALSDCLRIRRQLGYKLKADERLLENFVAFLEQAGAVRITTELAVMWARLPLDARPFRWRERLGIVRGFARYLATIDPESEVPSKDLLPAHRPRVAPYIYSPEQIAALMHAAGALTPPLRAASYRTVIGLMATSGLRLGETLDLDRQDVDLHDGALHVRARQTKQREVPLHPSTTAALREYTRLRERYWPTAQTPAFFLNVRGARITNPEFNRWFAKLIGQVGLEGAGERVRPRPHDL